MKITVLFNPRRITILYTMYPFWFSKNKKEFDFTYSLDWVLNKDKNKKLLLVGWFKGQDIDGFHKKLLEKLLTKYEIISYLDDNDGTESHYLDLLPYFKFYYKKQVFVNREDYLKDYYGNRIFTEYYHKEFNINEEPLPKPLPKIHKVGDLNKIKVSWNLGLGQYPVLKHRHHFVKLALNFSNSKFIDWFLTDQNKKREIPNPKLNKCHARFGYKGYRTTIGFQRKLFLELIKNNDHFLSGLVPSNQYKNEIKEIQAILSPFGWGEVCFRDFEAILNGGVLVKPKMDHIETWPNIYNPYQTYIPIEWDGSDLESRVLTLLDNQGLMKELRVNAWETLHDSYSLMDEKIVGIIEDFKEN